MHVYVLQMANIRLLKQYAESGISEYSTLKTAKIEDGRNLQRPFELIDPKEVIPIIYKRKKGKTNNNTTTNAWPQSLYNALRGSTSSQKARLRSVCTRLTVKSTANNACMETTNHIRKLDLGRNKSQCEQSTRNKLLGCTKTSTQRSTYDRYIVWILDTRGERGVTPNRWSRNTWWAAEHTIKRTLKKLRQSNSVQQKQLKLPTPAQGQQSCQ